MLGGFPVPARHRRAAAPIPAAPPPRVLERAGGVSGPSASPEHEAKRPRFRLYSLRGRSPALHRRDLGDVRDADAPVQCGAALSADLLPDEPLELEAQINLRTRSIPCNEAANTADVKATTLTDMLESNRDVDAHRHLSRRRERRADVTYGEVYERALGILHHLQAHGARRGDKLIMFLSNNEQFIDAFWAAILGRHRAGAARRSASATSIATSFCGSPASSAGLSSTPSDARSSASALRRAGRRDRALRGTASRAFLVDRSGDISRAGEAAPGEPRTTSPSSSSPPARPASRRAWCSRTATSSPTDGRDPGGEFTGHGRRAFVDAAHPRHGTHRLPFDHVRRTARTRT